ncbi:hypothetical protein AgCh_026563 [Apium graveolens]
MTLGAIRSAGSSVSGQTLDLSCSQYAPQRRKVQKCRICVMMVKPTIQIKETDEHTFPDVKLTKSRNRTNGNGYIQCRVMTTIYGDHGVSMSKRYNGVSKLSITIYNGFKVWLMEINYNDEFRAGPVWNQIGTLYWLAFSTLFTLRRDKQFIKDGNGGVAFVALIIIQSYTASLSSMLIAQSLEPIVKDVATLMKLNATTGYFQRSFLRSYIIGTLGFDPAKVRKYPSTAAGYAKALNTKEIVRIIFEVPPAKVFLAQFCKSFIKSDRTFKDEGFGFKAFEKGFPLLPGINNAIMNITESGKLLELEKK